MSIRGKVASSLQSSLGGRRSTGSVARQGAIPRQRKFTGASLLKTMVLTLLKSPAARTDVFVATAAQLGVSPAVWRLEAVTPATPPTTSGDRFNKRPSTADDIGGGWSGVR